MFHPNTKILIVDDVFGMRKLIKKICNELGFTTLLEAEDGEKAWSTICESTPPIELVISDWNMPGSTGLDLLKKLRADQRFSKTPFLMVTAESDAGEIVEAIKCGVNNYVMKPVSAETLKDKLEAIHKKLS